MGQRIVVVAALAGAFAALVCVAEEVRVFDPRIAMDRGEQNIVAAVENVLGAVAMVIVDIRIATRRAPWSRNAWVAMAALLRKQ